MDEQNTREANRGGPVSQITLYNKVVARQEKIFQAIDELIVSKNPSVRLGVIKILINKILPDLKSVELGGTIDESGKRQPIQIFINRGSGFVPAFVDVQAPSDSGDERSSPVQDISVAPASEKDDNSDNGNHNPESA